MPRWRQSVRRCLLAVLPLACLLVSVPAHGYVDLAPTLARVISESERIILVEVAAFSREKHVLVLKEVRAMRGALSSEAIRHVVAPAEGAAVPRHILRWTPAGSQGVLFVSHNTALVCVGEGWYQVSASGGDV